MKPIEILYILGAISITAQSVLYVYEFVRVTRIRLELERQAREARKRYDAAVQKALKEHSPTAGCDCWGCTQARAIQAQGGTTHFEGSAKDVAARLARKQGR